MWRCGDVEMWKWGNVEMAQSFQLDMLENSIHEWPEIVANITILAIDKLTKCLCILDLDDNNCIESIQRGKQDFMANHSTVSSIMYLLKLFSKLGYLGVTFMNAMDNGIFPKYVAHQLDTN